MVGLIEIYIKQIRENQTFQDVEVFVDKPSLSSLFLEPRSVIFVGVPRKTGLDFLNPLDNLRDWGYQRKIYPVHPYVKEISGLPTLEHVSSLKEPADLAVISTPRESVPEIVRDCTKKGIRALIVTVKGFAEADAKGVELTRAMVDAARKGGARILGPNTLGVYNAFDGFTSSVMPVKREASPIGVICQSGTFFVAARDFTGGMGIGVDIGNACDLDFADVLEWLGSDPRINVLALHAEGTTSGGRFLETARAISKRIPVVILKTGRSSAGMRAAVSHSGSMGSEDRVVDAALRKAGLLRARGIQELHDLTRAIIRIPVIRGPRVAVVTLTGGCGIIALDAMEAQGFEPASLSAGTLKGLQDLSPPWMPIGNPMDIFAALMKHGIKRVYRKALKDALKDPEVDGVICITLALEQPEHASLDAVEVFQELSQETEKPILVWLYGSKVEEARVRLEERGRALAIPTVERGVTVLAQMACYQRWKENQW